MQRFMKIDAKGVALPDDAKKWVAVLDNTTGLMWSADDIVKGSKTWAAANDAASGANLCTFKDWRLPTVEELFLLADRSKHGPAIDTAFFPKTKSDWYWSASPAAFSPAGCAWLVYFDYGNSDWTRRSALAFVRAVRSASSPRQ